MVITGRPLHERVRLWFHGRSTPAFLLRALRGAVSPRPSWLTVTGGAAFTWSAWQLHPVVGGCVLGMSCLVANWRVTERRR